MKEQNSPLQKHKKISTLYREAKMSGILPAKSDHRHLSFYNYLSKLCNLKLDTTKP